MDFTSLYTNIPQEEGINIVCNAYEAFHRKEPPSPTRLLQRALKLILAEDSFQFNGKTTYTYMGLPWAPTWQLLSPIFL